MKNFIKITYGVQYRDDSVEQQGAVTAFFDINEEPDPKYQEQLDEIQGILQGKTGVGLNPLADAIQKAHNARKDD